MNTIYYISMLAGFGVFIDMLTRMANHKPLDIASVILFLIITSGVIVANIVKSSLSGKDKTQ